MQVEDVMHENVVTCELEDTRDSAATVIESHKIHHLIVIGAHKEFKGVISSMDVAREVMLDAKAWPYSREAFSAYN
jgi:CBS domain-containing protein